MKIAKVNAAGRHFHTKTPMMVIKIAITAIITESYIKPCKGYDNSATRGKKMNNNKRLFVDIGFTPALILPAQIGFNNHWILH